MKYQISKTILKVVKNFGLLALAGAVAALSPEAVDAILKVIPGQYAAIAALLLQAGLAFLRDWLKHRKDGQDAQSL